MSQLVYRCKEAGRVIATGIDIERKAFATLQTLRTVPCKFCAREHAWELVDRVPGDCAVMSLLPGTFFGRSVKSAELATWAIDPDIRQEYERMADKWYQLAVDYETRTHALR